MSSERIPPQAVDMEKSVLGAVMIHPDSFSLIRDLLDETCFYNPAHGLIFTAMSHLDRKQSPVDLLTVSEELREMGKLEEVGGDVALSNLTEFIPSSAAIEYHARQVLQKATLRRLISLGITLSSASYEPDAQPQDLLEKLQSQLAHIINQHRFSGSTKMRTAVSETLNRINEIKAQEGCLTGIGSGFNRLDDMTTGFQNGELIVLAARPSVGKTALALNIARNAAEKGHGVAFFSLEMNRQQLVMRLLSGDARIDNIRLRSSSKLRDGEQEDLDYAAAQLSECQFFIDDTPSIGIFSIRARARQLWTQHKIGLIILDYLQLIRPPKPVNSQQEWVSFLSASMKGLARELNIPVIVLSQLSRAPEQRSGQHKPVLSDLRDSGAIEQDADIVIFLYRPELYPHIGKNRKYKFQGHEYDLTGFTEVIVAKNRNGPTGSFPLTFVKRYTSFETLADELPPVETDDEEALDDTEQPF